MKGIRCAVVVWTINCRMTSILVRDSVAYFYELVFGVFVLFSSSSLQFTPITQSAGQLARERESLEAGMFVRQRRPVFFWLLFVGAAPVDCVYCKKATHSFARSPNPERIAQRTANEFGALEWYRFFKSRHKFIVDRTWFLEIFLTQPTAHQYS